MPAGPSEVEVIADITSNPAFVASDFLSQAEHGRDSQSILLTTDETFVEQFQIELEEQLDKLPRRELAKQSLEHSKVVILRDNDQIVKMTNHYAPEHLIIQTID